MTRRFGASTTASSVSSSELIISVFWSIAENVSLQLLRACTKCRRHFVELQDQTCTCACTIHLYMHHSKQRSQSQWPNAQTPHSFTGTHYKMAIATMVPTFRHRRHQFPLPFTDVVKLIDDVMLRWRRDDVAVHDVEVLTSWFDVTIDNVTFGLDDVSVDAVVVLDHVLFTFALKTLSNTDVYTLHVNMYMYMHIYIHIHVHDESVHARMHVHAYNNDDKIKIQNALIWVHVLQELWKDPRIS